MFKDVRDEFNRILDSADISYTVSQFKGGYQWTFPNYPHGDIAIHSGTYYSDEGFLESYGMPWDNGDVSIYKPYDMALLLQGLPPREESRGYDLSDTWDSLLTMLG